MNDPLKMRNQRTSHFIPPLAFLQVLVVALLAFAAGGGGVYNLSVTDSATHVKYPVFSTANGDYVTNYLCITPAMTNALNFTIAPTDFLYGISWNFGGAATPNTATGTNAMVTLNMPLPTYTVPVTISSNRTNNGGSGGAICTTTNHTLVVLVPNYITRDGTMVNSTNNTVWVGQQINLTNYVATNIPSSAITFHQWAIPGANNTTNDTAFYDYEPNAEHSNYTNLFTPTNYTTNNYVQFYWSYGASNQVVYCTNVIYGATNVVSATFNVLSPTTNSISATTNAASPIAADTNYWSYPLYSSIFPAWLHFGPNTSAHYGVYFSQTNTAPPGFSGNFDWVQVIAGCNIPSTSSSGVKETVHHLPGVDTTYPYDSPTASPNFVADSPGSPLSSTDVSESENFVATMYLIWKASTSSTGGDKTVPVPLRAVNWSWNGSATNVSGWTLVPGSAAYPTNLTDFPATNEPTWNTNSTNSYITSP